MTKQGFIKLHRKIQEHWIYQEKRKFSRYESWLDMLMMANHKGNKFLLGNELVEVEKGSFVTSELKLMDRWDWGKAKLRTFLEMLEKDEMIVKKSDRKKTTITICNYCLYHTYETENRPIADHEQTDSRPPADTNKNVKNDKNEKKNNIPLEIENFRQRYSDNQSKIIDRYLEMIKHTRVSGKISESVIIGMYKDWDKCPAICVEYGLKTHTDNPAYHSKKENYTLGIIRNTTADEAANKLNGVTANKKNDVSWEDL
jgi:hypothetical protein